MYAYYHDTGMMVRLSDGQVVQPEVDPVATAEYQAWLASGGVPDEFEVTPQVT